MSHGLLSRFTVRRIYGCDYMDVFDEAVSPFARQFPLGSLRPETIPWILVEFRDYARGHIEFLRRTYPQLPRIHFGFTDLGTINAGAFRHKGDYIIFVNTGTIAMLSLFFTRVLADRRLFRDIGNPEKETDDLPRFNALLPDAEMLLGQFRNLVVPRDQQRIDYSHGLLHRAFRFLFSHELTHILSGHVDYLLSLGVSALVELTAAEMPIEKLDRQAMEMDADNGGAEEGMHTLMAKIAPKPEVDPEVSNQQYFNPKQGLFAWLFAVDSLFRFFGDERFTLPQLRTYYYPPPRMRQILIASTAARFIETKTKRPDLGALCRRSSPLALAAVEEAFTTVSRTPRSVAGLEAAALSIPEHMSLVARHWRESMRPRLAPFAYVNLVE